MKNDFGSISVPYGDAGIAILPVPYEGTVTYGNGTRLGPQAIMEASRQVETYDMLTERDFEKLRFATLDPIEIGDVSPDMAVAEIEKRVTSIVGDGKLPFLIGGEHSITPPAVRAVAKSREIGVVQLDAHADLRPEYEGSIHNHACVMARVRETCPAVQIGIRSCSHGEKELIEKEKYTLFTAGQTLGDGKLETALNALPEEVYLTVDIDLLDPSIMPSTGTPEPGGLGWEETNDIIRMVGEIKKIVGADVVELAPIAGMHAPDFLAAKLVFNILAQMVKGD